MFKINKRKKKKIEDNFYLPNFKIKKNFNLGDLSELIDVQIFPKVRTDKEFMLKHGGDLDCFPSTFDFIIALCLNPNITLQYLKSTIPDIICFTVMILDDLLFSKRFRATEIHSLLSNYVMHNKSLFTNIDYAFCIDELSSNYIDIADDDIFEKCFLPNYVDIEKCISKVFSEYI